MQAVDTDESAQETTMLRIGLLAAACILWIAAAAKADDAAAARTTLKAMFDKPDTPLTVDPLVIVGNYGIADWSQAETGGRALLRRNDGAWHIALCSGDALRSAATLRRIGLPSEIADSLAGQLAEAEKSVPPPRLAQFASFEGTVPMDPGALNAAGANP